MFLENNNQPLLLDDLIIKCDTLGFILDETEIETIIKSHHSKDFKIIKDQKRVILSLTQDRYNLLQSKSENNIEKYITLFIETLCAVWHPLKGTIRNVFDFLRGYQY